jgi:hypothetical protein
VRNASIHGRGAGQEPAAAEGWKESRPGGLRLTIALQMADGLRLSNKDNGASFRLEADWPAGEAGAATVAAAEIANYSAGSGIRIHSASCRLLARGSKCVPWLKEAPKR